MRRAPQAKVTRSSAVVLAGLAVLYLTVMHGQFPWIALVLAGTFGFYSLLRNTAGYEALPGLFLETSVLFLPALLYLAVIGPGSWDALDRAAWPTYPLLAGTGLVGELCQPRSQQLPDPLPNDHVRQPAVLGQLGEWVPHGRLAGRLSKQNLRQSDELFAESTFAVTKIILPGPELVLRDV